MVWHVDFLQSLTCLPHLSAPIFFTAPKRTELRENVRACPAPLVPWSTRFNRVSTLTLHLHRWQKSHWPDQNDVQNWTKTGERYLSIDDMIGVNNG